MNFIYQRYKFFLSSPFFCLKNCWEHALNDTYKGILDIKSYFRPCHILSMIPKRQSREEALIQTEMPDPVRYEAKP